MTVCAECLQEGGKAERAAQKSEGDRLTRREEVGVRSTESNGAGRHAAERPVERRSKPKIRSVVVPRD